MSTAEADNGYTDAVNSLVSDFITKIVFIKAEVLLGGATDRRYDESFVV